MIKKQSPQPVDLFIDTLMRCTGQLMLVVDHMSRHPNPDDSAPPCDEVLRRLLAGILEPKLGSRTDELRKAAALLTAATEAVGDELFLVEPDELRGAPPSNGAPHPRRGSH